MHYLIYSRQPSLDEATPEDLDELEVLHIFQFRFLSSVLFLAMMKILKHLRNAPTMGPHVRALIGCLVTQRVWYFLAFLCLIVASLAMLLFLIGGCDWNLNVWKPADHHFLYPDTQT